MLIAKNHRQIYARAFGCADLENHVPSTPDTCFRLASVSKQFTAMATLLLLEQRRLLLTEPLIAFFPGFPEYGRKIRLKHLLQHTSGLPDYEDLIPGGTTLPVLDYDVLRILTTTREGLFPPGTQYRYSNSGYALLALIVEQRSGLRFAEFLAQHIFTPLAMTRTVAFEFGRSTVQNRAYGYTRNPDGGFSRTDQNLTSSVLGDGGIYSCVTDLFQWAQALDTETLVKQDTLRLAFRPGPLTDLPNTRYGFGWYLGRYRGAKEVWHSGDTIGFRTRIVRYPETGSSIILLCNRTQADLSPIARSIADAVLFS